MGWCFLQCRAERGSRGGGGVGGEGGGGRKGGVGGEGIEQGELELVAMFNIPLSGSTNSRSVQWFRDEDSLPYHIIGGEH